MEIPETQPIMTHSALKALKMTGLANLPQQSREVYVPKDFVPPPASSSISKNFIPSLSHQSEHKETSPDYSKSWPKIDVKETMKTNDKNLNPNPPLVSQRYKPAMTVTKKHSLAGNTQKHQKRPVNSKGSIWKGLTDFASEVFRRKGPFDLLGLGTERYSDYYEYGGYEAKEVGRSSDYSDYAQ